MIDIRTPLPSEEAVKHLVTVYKERGNPVDKAIPRVCELVVSAYKDIPPYSYKYKTKKEGPFKTWAIPFLQYRLTVACILADNMNAEAELVVSALIGPGLETKLFYRNTLEPKIGTAAYERISSVLRTVPNTFTSIHVASEKIDELLWKKALEQQYQDLTRVLRRNGAPQIYYIRQAYDLAYETHRDVFRQSGEPYLSHPLAVAKILAEKGAESELVAAALLHDVIEDSVEEPDQSRSRIEKISPRIARYVEAVTSVDREYQILAKEKGLREDAVDNEDLDRATVNKLLNMAREDESMIQAVYIKAADRYHNLLTIDGMPYNKIRNKLDETEEYYLPVFRAFGINEFIPAIEDQLWRVRKPDLYHEVKDKYDRLLSLNRSNLNETHELLSSVVDKQIEEKCRELNVPVCYADIRKEDILPNQVYEMIKNDDTDELLSSISKYNVPLMYYSVVSYSNSSKKDLGLFTSIFVKTLQENMEDLKNVITKIWTEPISPVEPDHRRIAIEIENEMSSRIIVYIYDQDDYYLYKKGSIEGVVTPDRSDDLEMLAGSIRVHRADDSVTYLPIGSTALDFAFDIHEEVGLNAAKASINGSEPSERLLYSTLHDDDKVVIKKADDLTDNPVKIEWLNHVVTSTARKRITRWLQDMYEKNDKQ